MKRKISYRKKLAVETIAPMIIILAALIRMDGIAYGDAISNGSFVLAVLCIGFMLYNSYRKNFEPEDEMARLNQQKADVLSFRIALAFLAVVILYLLFAGGTLTISLMTLVIVFASMNILSFLLFLYFDIRGE